MEGVEDRDEERESEGWQCAEPMEGVEERDEAEEPKSERLCSVRYFQRASQPRASP